MHAAERMGWAACERCSNSGATARVAWRVSTELQLIGFAAAKEKKQREPVTPPLWAAPAKLARGSGVRRGEERYSAARKCAVHLQRPPACHRRPDGVQGTLPPVAASNVQPCEGCRLLA